MIGNEAAACERRARTARLTTALRKLGDAKYHHRHPLHLLMHAGRLDASDLRLWVSNRYYYQTRIPIKDALIVAKSEDPTFRRAWLRRIVDHDGSDEATAPGQRLKHGGLQLWRELAVACGIREADLEAHHGLVAGARQACDDYVEFVRNADLLTAVASSLTEAFAGSILQVRLEAWKEHYPWIRPQALTYFQQRVARAPADAKSALSFIEQWLETDEQLEQCLRAVEFKCDVLWRLLDAVYLEARRGRAPRLTRRVVVHSEPLGGALAMAPERGYELNETGQAFLDLCREGLPLEELAHRLAQRYASEAERILKDLTPFVAELERRRILEFAPGPTRTSLAAS